MEPNNIKLISQIIGELWIKNMRAELLLTRALVAIRRLSDLDPGERYEKLIEEITEFIGKEE